MVKVVMVARNPELEETARKKGKTSFSPVSFLSCVYGMSGKLIACLLHSKQMPVAAGLSLVTACLYKNKH